MSAVMASAVADGRRVVFRHDAGEVVFDDPQRALDAAQQLMDAARLAINVQAGEIAEARALVGSAAHHMDRGASSAHHYDRRVAALVGPPITDVDEILDNAGGAAVGGFAPGDSPATGTSQASVDALEGRQVPGVGAMAEPPFASTEGLKGGPPGTVSPEPPGEAMASQGEGGTPVPLSEAQPNAGDGEQAEAPAAEADAGSGAYSSRTAKQLKVVAKDKGISGYSSMTKAQLLKALKA